MHSVILQSEGPRFVKAELPLSKVKCEGAMILNGFHQVMIDQHNYIYKFYFAD